MYDPMFERLGLSRDEARVYEALVTGGSQGAGDLLGRVKMKRGLLYKVIDRLQERELITADEHRGRAIWTAAPPDALLKIVDQIETAARGTRHAVEDLLPELKAKYVLATERPIIRLFEGVEALKKIYEDTLESGAKEFYFIRPVKSTVSYERAYGRWFKNYRERRAAAGITTYGITPDDADTNHDPKVDASWKLVRTWLRPSDYSAPVEINLYADRVAVISYGKEVFGLVIENAPLAKAFKELFKLADRGSKTIPVKHAH